ncbi:hypothetical protein LJC36_03170 [Desulfovibrio sp. OttesenSCG-928-C14]|nr:hypothetical protein [Desulfovibrio sp. OttesenSCG-928-C14]
MSISLAPAGSARSLIWPAFVWLCRPDKERWPPKPFLHQHARPCFFYAGRFANEPVFLMQKTGLSSILQRNRQGNHLGPDKSRPDNTGNRYESENYSEQKNGF